jgi:hypothetical protein
VRLPSLVTAGRPARSVIGIGVQVAPSTEDSTSTVS